MKAWIKLLRPKDWAKNLFIFIPLFFSGQFFKDDYMLPLLAGFICFSLVSSSIYIFNDYRDIEDDRIHPIKKDRPLASGAIPVSIALFVSVLLMIAGLTGAWFIRDKFLFVLGLYAMLNLAYSLGLKNIPILDIVIISIGFVLRIKAGSVIARIGLSEWLIIMVFLLALFMAFAKRRDDVMLEKASGKMMRKSASGYNLEFINVATAVICAVMIVSYFMYTMSPEVKHRLGTYRIYYTTLFVIMGLLRYLQLIYVHRDSQSPVKILYKDRFIQACILLWIFCFYVILYVKDFNLFN